HPGYHGFHLRRLETPRPRRRHLRQPLCCEPHRRRIRPRARCPGRLPSRHRLAHHGHGAVGTVAAARRLADLARQQGSDARRMTTPLADKIKAIIAAHGPISVTDYFALCLADPEYGYYKTRDPFGRGGDFVTAPEVSQLFGEMVGIFLVHAW